MEVCGPLKGEAMNAESQRVRDMFVVAVKLPPDVWEAFLKEACGGDEGLHLQVSELLRSHQQAGSFLDQPEVDLEATDDIEPAGNGVATVAQEVPGTTIGPHKLLKRIGEGGWARSGWPSSRSPCTVRSPSRSSRRAWTPAR